MKLYNKNMEEFAIIKHIGNAGVVILVAIAGGIAKYAKEYLDSGEFDIKKFIANIFVAAFAGLMFGYFGQGIGVNENTQLMFAGVGGFMGYEAVNFLFKTITREKI